MMPWPRPSEPYSSLRPQAKAFPKRRPTPNGEGNPDHGAFPTFSGRDASQLLGDLYAREGICVDLRATKPRMHPTQGNSAAEEHAKMRQYMLNGAKTRAGTPCQALKVHGD
jgi:hypothetical protein